MGQTPSRHRPASRPTPASASMATPEPGQTDNTHPPRRSLPSRILSSLRKPSLRSHSLSPSLTPPTRPEQTLRGKNRRWWLSRRHDIAANTEGAVPEHMDSLPEHDEHQVDRDVDEFGVITHRVHDYHSDSPAPSAKGKQKATDVSDIEDDIEDDDDDTPIPSTSIAPPLARSGAARDPVRDDEILIAPTVPPSPPPPSPPIQEPEHRPIPLPPAPMPPSSPQPPAQQAGTSLRPFPPPGTLVVVQGVVHTTDVPRSSDRPPNPTPPTTNDPLNSSTNTHSSSTRPSSVPPETRPRNPLSGILPRPSSMVPAVPSPEPMAGSSSNDSSARQTTSNANGAVEESEDEDRTHTHPHGLSMAQGPSGLSASSIDVLGTLLSVAAAATAASLLTGSSEPIFSSGLTASQPPPSSNSISQTTALNSNVPSERPLSPTPTSDAGRMRHVWSSLRDRLGLGSGTHNSNPSNDTAPSLGPGQFAPQPTDVVRPRDPREIMLAEMARAFNLGLGLGGTTTGTASAVAPANLNNAELAIPDDGDGLVEDRDVEQTSFPPPDSFERFLMDLQSDLRATLMQEQEPVIIEPGPRDIGETTEDVEGDQSIPELQSLSDSGSEEFGTGHFGSDAEGELDCEDDVDNEGDEGDVHIAQEQLSRHTSPAVSALSAGIHHPSNIGTSSGSPSFGTSGTSPPHTAPRQSISTATPSGTDCEIVANSSAANDSKSGGAGVTHTPRSVSNGIGAYVAEDSSNQTEMRSEEEPEGQRGGAVLGVVHSREASNEEGTEEDREAEGCRAVSGSIAVPPLGVQNPSNPLETTRQDSFLLGTSSVSGPSTSNTPGFVPGGSVLTSQVPTRPSTSALSPTSSSEPTTQHSSSTNPIPGDSSMPFRLPFTPSSASRTEHTPGGGINWWRMYRFPAIASSNMGQQGGPQGPSPLSQPAFRTPAQVPSHSSISPWAHTDESQQNEMIASRGVAQVPGPHSELVQTAPVPSATTSANMPEIVSASNRSTSSPTSTNDQDPGPPTNASTNLPEHRGNVVVPVIVVGLQSVNMDRQPPRMPHPHANHIPAIDDEDGEGMDFDALEQSMSMPLHIPEPPEFRRHSSPSNVVQEQNPSRGRTWHSRAANAIRNLRPSRRNADTISPPPQETPGSRTFLIYVIGGYYPPDHQIITGGNLDSFEALWELAELLGQVKPPTVSKEEIEKSGLEIIKASKLEDYEKQGRVASNCTDRCLICLDDYDSDDDLRVLTCKHTFHQDCVDRWLETGRNNCPACRTKGVGNEGAGLSSAAASTA